MAKRTVESLVECVASIKKRFEQDKKNLEQTHKERLSRVDAFYCFLQEALSMGFVPDFSEFDVKNWATVGIDIKNLKDFSKVHALVGTLEQQNIQPLKDDGRCRDVEVTLKPKNEEHPYGFLRFKFRKKLPRQSKCKVKKVTRTYYNVVCER